MAGGNLSVKGGNVSPTGGNLSMEGGNVSQTGGKLSMEGGNLASQGGNPSTEGARRPTECLRRRPRDESHARPCRRDAGTNREAGRGVRANRPQAGNLGRREQYPCLT